MKINWRTFGVSGLTDKPRTLYLFGTDFLRENQITASLDWMNRSREEIREGVRIVIAHEIDVLVNHIVNSKECQLLAFLAEIKTEPEEYKLKTALQNVVDAFRPDFPYEDRACDPASNTQIACRAFYGKCIDIHEEIILPAIRMREKFWKC